MKLEVWCDNETGNLYIITRKKPLFEGYRLYEYIRFTDTEKFLKMFTFIGYL